MTEAELERQDQEVALMAVQALSEAQHRAERSGQELVYFSDGKLIKSGPEGTVILKLLPPREKVLVRVKRARQ